MPAQRSRTTGWRRCLRQLADHGGSLQVALAPATDGGSDFIWRARLLRVDDDHILIETPTAAGEPLPLREGAALVAIMAIGQNRWMFRTACLETTCFSEGRKDATPAIRLEMPTGVERCQRRRDYRIDTAQLELPQVTAWPLLDPRSVVLSERLCQLRGVEEQDAIQDEDVMPDVGPAFPALLANIGGGGVGLRVNGPDAASVGGHRLYWMRFPLPGDHSDPICVTAKLVHWHLESSGATYMGMMFDFSFNPSHRRFVVQEITRAVAVQQREQFRAAA